jgi:hypothetical protein
MKTIDRNYDIATGADDLEHLYTFKNFPVFMGCVDQPQSEDAVSDMNWHISKSSGMIQLNPLLPLDVVYQTEHNPGTTGTAWLDHHRAFAKFIEQYDPKNVFEIGGAHGILSQYYQDNHATTKWTILEPNPIPVPELKATMIQGFFTEDTVLDKDVDMIVHSHVLEHVYEPSKFLRSFINVELGTKMCFSIPNLKLYLQRRYTNALNFEHTFYCSEEYVKWWLERNGFELLEEYYYSDFSIFYSCVKTTMHVMQPLPANLYEDNKQLFQGYLDHHVELVDQINKDIDTAAGPVYLFGAHVFSQFLLSFGLNRSAIVSILDNSVLKQGKRLYGTDLNVDSPQVLKDKNNPTVILRCGVFNDEIKKDILENINSSTRFLE